MSVAMNRVNEALLKVAMAHHNATSTRHQWALLRVRLSTGLDTRVRERVSSASR